VKFIYIYIYESRLKNFGPHEDGISRQNYSDTTNIQSYVFCKILVKTAAILDAQLLFENHLCQSMSVFSFDENLCPPSLILRLGNRKKSLEIWRIQWVVNSNS